MWAQGGHWKYEIIMRESNEMHSAQWRYYSSITPQAGLLPARSILFFVGHLKLARHYVHDEHVLLCFFSNFRNPDNDSTPWCYIYRGTQVVWEFCSVPKCTEGTAIIKQTTKSSWTDRWAISLKRGSCVCHFVNRDLPRVREGLWSVIPGHKVRH